MALRILGFLFSTCILCLSGAALAQAPGECSGGLCGTPDESGGGPCVGVCGGCGCGCGSILIANTDLGDTYQYADDYDEDGIEDDFDNCPFIPNRDQADGDGDTVGESCDNCKGIANLAQEDADGDKLGDLCDLDIDGDEIGNLLDNCPQIANPSQVNTDMDLYGDACDPDIDDDGALNIADNCAYVYNPNQNPTDPDTLPGCNVDQDDDGVIDFVDNCQLVANPEQLDTDGNLTGDACSPDMDGDGLLNQLDNCPMLYNTDQEDADRDRVGDPCDTAYCYVVDRVDACLDPTTAFGVYAGDNRLSRTGDTVPLLMYANRKNRAIEYEWSLVDRPGGSRATIRHPKGSTSLSTPYNYHYKKGRAADFVPDQPGVYTIKLVARLVFADELYPEKQVASAEFQLTAEGEPQTGGCATTGPGAVSLLGLALAAAWALRRRLS